jgi:hypothetical protein
VKRYRAQVADANRLREEEVTLLRQELEHRTTEMLSVQRALEGKLGRVNDSLNRRTARSKCAYGFQIPLVSSPRSNIRGYEEAQQRQDQSKRMSKIPRYRTKSPSTLASERINATRQARDELASAACFAACSPIHNTADDLSEADTVADSVKNKLLSLNEEMNDNIHGKTTRSISSRSNRSTLIEETQHIKEYQRQRDTLRQQKEPVKTKTGEESSQDNNLDQQQQEVYGTSSSFFGFSWPSHNNDTP